MTLQLDQVTTIKKEISSLSQESLAQEPTEHDKVVTVEDSLPNHPSERPFSPQVSSRFVTQLITGHSLPFTTHR